VFGLKPDDTTTREYASEIDKAWIFDLDVSPPNVKMCFPVLLADEFTGFPMKPLGETYPYLVSLWNDIRDKDDLQQISASIKALTETQLVWLGTRLEKILSPLRSSKEKTILFDLLNRIIGFVKPTGFSRSCLFMVVANVTQRSRNVSFEHIWFSICRPVCCEGALYGLPYEDWDALDRITFAWLLSVGPVSVEIKTLPFGREDAFESLVIEFSMAKPVDFVDLLSVDQVGTFLAKEGCGSILLYLGGPDEAKTVILRTGAGEHGRLSKEYVWIREEGKVVFSEGGFSICCATGVQVRPTGSKLWFSVGDDDLEYFDTHYAKEFVAAAKDFERVEGFEEEEEQEDVYEASPEL
jgi:hypothetical protein